MLPSYLFLNLHKKLTKMQGDNHNAHILKRDFYKNKLDEVIHSNFHVTKAIKDAYF